MTIIRSELLAKYSNIICGISTNSDGISAAHFGFNLSFNVGDVPDRVQENRNRFFNEMGITEMTIAKPQQEHTSNVIVCSEPINFPHCDALITHKTDLYLSISIADCTPIMFFDPERNVVAAVHAGWRGTHQHIVQNTLKEMINSFQSNPKDIMAFIGPSAGVCCYEVGKEVADLFPPVCIHVKKNGKFHLDVKLNNKMQLLESNLLESHIEVHQGCSIHNTNYHSFRREGKKSGRMLAVIGMKN